MAGRTAPLALSVRVVLPAVASLAVPAVFSAAPNASASTPVARTNASTAAQVTPPAPCVPGGEVRGPAPDNWVRVRYPTARTAPLSTGSGVTVAVIDSGVDGHHRLLAGRVAPGRDYLDPGGDGTRDCVGHGTAVASIIAGVGGSFRGLAPRARILPVRVSERQWTAGDPAGRTVSPATFGNAIRWAVDHGARVLNLSVVLTEDRPEVRAAIEYAARRDAVVVAAGGNQAERGGPSPYPARYPDVIGVGAVGADGTRLPFSQVGPYVDLTAPGTDVPAAGPHGRLGTFAGTSYATAFVSAAAALLRSAHPEYTATDVTRHLLATADPSPGARDAGYGAGTLNPYRALTETVATPEPRAAAPLPPATANPIAAAAQAREQHQRVRALRFAGWATGAAVVALLLAAVMPHGTRRRWRAPARR